MELFKKIKCEHCGEKASKRTRSAIKFDEYLCAKCVKDIPWMIKSCLSEYTYGNYLEMMEYIKEADSSLGRVFRETNYYRNIHLDQDNGIFYLGDESPRVYLKVGNIQRFELIFEPEKLKAGFLSTKVKGSIRLEMVMKEPYINYNKVIDTSAKANAKVSFIGDKVEYGMPQKVEEFLDALQKSSKGLKL